IQGFTWKSFHGAYKIGEYWSLIPNYECRGDCDLCGDMENMQHILIECQISTAVKTIW
ncbi:hypothetical protein M405DRAFT_698110, partial [Rhizopogon salebrosus TDB-379]